MIKKTDFQMKYTVHHFLLCTFSGYKDYGYYMWFTDMEDPRFDSQVLDFYHQTEPLYKELHAYVRYKLSRVYPGRFDPSGPMPAHILGNVWGQEWQSIFRFVKPYKHAASINIGPAMRAQNWTVLRMVKAAEDFFTSIGLYEMPPKFWAHSMFTKPKNRSVQCQATAYDMYGLDDFR